MRYSDLKELVAKSNSSRKQFLSYTPEMQLMLCEFSAEIHSTADMHLWAGRIESYQKALENSEYYDKRV